MRVNFIDLKIKNKKTLDHYKNIYGKIIKSGIFYNGKHLKKLELNLKKYTKRKHCVGVSSGTGAVYLAIKTLKSSIFKKDEVITTPLSWLASSNAILENKLKPVFADIKDDLTIDPISIEKMISNKTKAILIVNYTGQVCDIEALDRISKEYKIPIIEDGAQSFGATYKNKKSGSFGKISAISHNPMKVFSAFGEAGSIFTDDDEIYKKLIYYRYNGSERKDYRHEYSYKYSSLNFRMDEVQASVLNEKLKNINQTIKKRKLLANLYDKLLDKIIKIPERRANEERIYYTYTIKVNKKYRKKLQEFLFSKNIETKIYYDKLIPEVDPYKKFNFKSDIKNAKKISKEVLCLPMHENLNTNQIYYVCEKVKEFFNG
jgi:dTDP-4-amino-4,6-dideoxygalactose transaminase